MSPDARMQLFLAVAAVLVALLHLYIGKRLRAATPRGRAAGRVLLASSAASMVAGLVGGHFLARGPLSGALAWCGFLALGLLLVLFPLTLARDVVLGLERLASGVLRLVRRGASAEGERGALALGRGGARSRRRGHPGAGGAPAPAPEPARGPADARALTRRELLRRGSGWAVLGFGGAIGCAGLWGVERRAQVVEVQVPIEGLHPDLEGLAIAQISDLHVGPTIGRATVDDVVDRVNALGADLIVMTGDLVDGHVGDLAHAVAPIARLAAPLGTYFVTGNHEYYWDARAWTAHVASLGLDVLVDEHRVLERGAARVALAGVPDIDGASFVPEHRHDPAGALAGAPAVDLRVLLAHQPRSLDAAVAAGYDLQLSGHTHGGQFFPYTFLIRLAQPVVAGLERFGRTWVYVNRGTGYWGPPLRSNGAGEITLVRLVRAGAPD
jgi:uncharacterized protein